MRAGSGRLRFAVDTGGTFTDLIVADDNGDIEMFKAPTQPADPVAGVLEVMGAAARGSGVLARRISRARRHSRPRHDARDQRDRNGSNRANRLSHDGGPSGHAGLSGRRPAGRLQLHRALSCAIRAQGADIRDSRAHPERRFGARAARRNRRGRQFFDGSRRWGWRRSPSVCCGRSSIRRTSSRSAP